MKYRAIASAHGDVAMLFEYRDVVIENGSGRGRAISTTTSGSTAAN